MSSGRESRWRRFLRKVCPFLFKQCPEGNWHWRLDKFCWCRVNRYGGGWHGGVLHFRTGMEFHPQAGSPNDYWTTENLWVAAVLAWLLGLLMGRFTQ